LDVACRDALEAGLQASDNGHVLIFLPGVFEIQRVARRLEPVAQRHDMLICPLHGSQPLAEQTAAIAPSSHRKIILATNVAETSITVDGVTLVIDSGLARYADYDPHRGLNRLSTRRISKASADQRAGRAGRTQPGTCIRLWDVSEWKHQPTADPPEIMRVDLSHACLDIFSWNPAGFSALNWLTEPSPAHVQSAQEVLRHIGAAHGEGEQFQLTDLGRQLVNFPLHPRLSRIILAGIQTGHPAWAVLIAAFLSDGMSQKSDLRAPEACNLIAHLQHVAEGTVAAAGHSRRCDRSVVAVAQLFHRLCRQSRAPQTLPPMPPESVLAGLILTGFPDRLCVIDRSDPRRGVMVGGTGIQLAAGADLNSAEALIALDVEKNDDRQRLATVRLAIPISLDELLKSDLPQIQRKTKFVCDDSHHRFSAVLETRFGDLCIKTQPDSNPDWDAARDFIHQQIQGVCWNLLEAEAALISLCRRVELLRRYTGRADVPELTREFLSQAITDWMVTGRRYELPDTEQIAELFLAQLPHDARYQLDTQLPAHLTLASGKRVAIDYTAEGPVIEARVADFLGTMDSPKLLGGRVTVICRILGPNFRPVQTTSDLAQFWQGSYHQIRKDLRGRYPRHPWPENPLAYVTPRSGRS
jgi:ATP-dependent helicase HrpB